MELPPLKVPTGRQPADPGIADAEPTDGAGAVPAPADPDLTGTESTHGAGAGLEQDAPQQVERCDLEQDVPGEGMPAQDAPESDAPAPDAPELRAKGASEVASAKLAKYDPPEGTSAEAAELEAIRARTMDQMIFTAPSRNGLQRKICFLSARQARIVTTTPGSIDRLLRGFWNHEPRLVIQLLYSPGFHSTPNGQQGVANEKVDAFMAEVLIPIAARTNAVIIVDGTESAWRCGLSQSFTRTLAIWAKRWSGDPPFTVISCSIDLGRPPLQSPARTCALMRP